MKSTCVVALALGLCLATENAEAQSGKAKPGATWYQRNIKAPYQRCVSCVTAPVRASSRAIPRPMPLLAPVTIATLPSMDCMLPLPLCVHPRILDAANSDVLAAWNRKDKPG